MFLYIIFEKLSVLEGNLFSYNQELRKSTADRCGQEF